MLLNKKIAQLVAISSLVISPLAFANEDATPSFDHVGASYVSYDILDESLTGFGLHVEKSFNEHVFFSAKHTDVSEEFALVTDQGTVNTELSALLTHGNLGYKFFNNGSTVVYGSVGYTRMKISANATDSSGALFGEVSEGESGVNAQLGLRSRFASNVEVDLAIRHIDIADETDQEVSLLARYYGQQNLSFFAGYSRLDSESSSLNLGVSYHF
ncbi:Outer membrane protein beta-barrel domain-containing protein [Pseudidiomarina maritima]|uniref:Outer membrane protein beta-barrel domain-containing protein n=1 Tax=Pseudidiomarina maritima TaxID=519453 RepID=A0A1I6GIK3_9GAMM|nr:outer membrane beta-barrel protein [Pseudidiomarina maritima]SFR42053.1 Outer membrane protein beta-barrel domain-containing protein [Pseudidiomarina maritima]